jgi:beta-1,4-mannooligosaccharide/beta-1,4-mannosyl-N-acetylglucosamine phosphorylase
MRPYYQTLLKRHESNPLIVPADFPHGPADAVFNCGQTMMGDTTILLVSVVRADGQSTNIWVARSDDGLNFTFDAEPLFERSEIPGIRELDRHIIDPRVTKIGDTYYIVRPTGSVVVGLLYKTTDFKSVEFIDCIALAHNRVPCLFPEKIGGYYWKIDRPSIGKPPDNQGGMWLSRSPDLIHWGHYRPLLAPFGPWGGHKIGPTPPIRTEAGWLEIFHGVARNCSTTRYSLGAMLLDSEDPLKILGRMGSYLITPETDYEFNGRTPDVIFSCGAIADLEQRRLRVYYGGADTVICLATGDLDAIIGACLEGGREPHR